MSTNAEINNFIIKHADAKYFADDLKLYKKHFPNSRLIPELEKAPEFAKKSLDERILSELLQNQDSCIDCIWENRGFIREKGKVVPLKGQKKENKKVENKPAPEKESKKDAGNKEVGAKEIVFENLLKTDLSKAKYNELKQFVFDLELQDKCENQKKETYLKVLTDYIAPATEPKKKEAPE